MAETAKKPDAIIACPFGYIGLWFDGQAVSAIRLLTGKHRARVPNESHVREAVAQIKAYLARPGHRFQLPIVESGTPFQKKVWRALRRIPPGRPVYYRDLAKKLGTSPRAIGGACRANPVPVITPCHRVVGMKNAGGFMGKTSGAPVRMKHWLLQHEQEQ